MGHGPVEVIMVGFPGSKFNGAIIPELRRLIDAGIITVIDGLVVSKDADGQVAFAELAEADGEAVALAGLLGEPEELIADVDVSELAEALAPNSTGAILIFEHSWAAGLRTAIEDSGGSMLADFRVPGPVVDELLAHRGPEA